MTYHSKYGVWRKIYSHIPTQGPYNALSDHTAYKEAAIEFQLALGMFKEANEVINRVKNAKTR